jgi:hypothetical protein
LFFQLNLLLFGLGYSQFQAICFSYIKSFAGYAGKFRVVILQSCQLGVSLVGVL